MDDMSRFLAFLPILTEGGKNRGKFRPTSLKAAILLDLPAWLSGRALLHTAELYYIPRRA
jgi:hypothetical protein